MSSWNSLAADPNDFRCQSLTNLPYAALLADTCRRDCAANGLPSQYQTLGQRQICCNDNLPNLQCAEWHSAAQGFSLPAFVHPQVDNLSGHYCGYARNARYTGSLKEKSE